MTNLIRLLDLPAEVLAPIDSKALSMGHARVFLGLEDDAERVRLSQLVSERGYSVRETENLVCKSLKGEGSAIRKPPELSVASGVLRTRVPSTYFLSNRPQLELIRRLIERRPETDPLSVA